MELSDMGSGMSALDGGLQISLALGYECCLSPGRGRSAAIALGVSFPPRFPTQYSAFSICHDQSMIHVGKAVASTYFVFASLDHRFHALASAYQCVSMHSRGL